MYISDMDKSDKCNMMDKRVVITGFGPFGDHAVNASWECVKLLKEEGIGEGVEVIIYEIPVEYSTVKKKVPEMWQKHNPDLIVHIGVSSIAEDLTLEQMAHNNDYNRKDVHDCIVDDLCCVPGADDCITAGLDMECICEQVNKSGTKSKAVVSQDAGRYLCDFSYFTSLHINKDRAAFIHVPPLDQPYSVQELVQALKVAILCMIEQVDKLS